MQSEKKVSLVLIIIFLCVLLGAGVFGYFYFVKPKITEVSNTAVVPTLKIKKNTYERLIRERGLPENPESSNEYGRNNPFSNYK